MFEESVTTSNCDASLHNGIWYKLSFRELQTGHWPVHVRIVCVSLHQLILGSMNKQSWNWISLVISQLKNVKNFDILVTKWLSTPALTLRKQVQSFPLLLRTLLSHKYFIYWTIIEWGWVWCEELCRSSWSMPSIGYCLHRPPNMVTMCRLWGFSGGTDNQKRWNIE